ncbi:MAG: hypothetical protein IJU41_03475 [Clostridia bacterium]|nr:hypothetical protein [Clostridia bacterium]
MKTMFQVNTRTLYAEDGTPHVTFGIDAVAEDGTVENSVPDAFDTREKAEELAKRCNDYDLAPEHLLDVIEDAMIS